MCDLLQNVVHETDAHYLHHFVVDGLDKRMAVGTVADGVVAVDVEFAVVVVGIVDSVIAFVVVTPSLYYLHLLMTFVAEAPAVNIVVSIGCPIFAAVGFLFLQRYGPVLVSVVCQTYLVSLVEVTENRQML